MPASAARIGRASRREGVLIARTFWLLEIWESERSTGDVGGLGGKDVGSAISLARYTVLHTPWPSSLWRV